jgi:hypothetical protein
MGDLPVKKEHAGINKARGLDRAGAIFQAKCGP